MRARAPKPECNLLMSLVVEGGLPYIEKAIGPGAHTKRPGEGRPVRDLLSGETSPAALRVWLNHSAAIRTAPAALFDSSHPRKSDREKRDSQHFCRW